MVGIQSYKLVRNRLSLQPTPNQVSTQKNQNGTVVKAELIRRENVLQKMHTSKR